MPTAYRRSHGLALVAAMVGFLGASAAPAVAGAPAADFPAKDALFHNYPEMVAEIHEVESAHPDLVDVFSIGGTPKGRSIWVAKVSDNVATDEDEPEVLFDAMHHGDEHLTLEQALYLFNTLVDDYGDDEEVADLVDSREIWIVFMVNPDGAQFDLGGDPYRGWRKNRQSHPTSSSVGTDLNRNYDYRWGCCGGSSGSPGSRNYRGWKAFSAPETQAMRDFVNSRVVGGQQQIRTHISLHTNGELILWPYAYTSTNVPGDMTTTDRTAFVEMAQDMAATNGYTAMQSGDWYISDGDEIDWMYGRHRIFSFTVELYPPRGSSIWALPARREDRRADRPQPRGAALSHRPGRLPLPGERHPDRELRRCCTTTSSCSAAGPAIHSARTRRRLRRPGPGRAGIHRRRARTGRSSWARRLPDPTPTSRACRPVPPRRRTTSTDGPRSPRARSSSRRTRATSDR